MLDEWPNQAACLDFGINTEQGPYIYEALQSIVRQGKVTQDELHEVVGDGSAIARLIQEKSGGEYEVDTFQTMWEESPLAET